MSRRAECPGRPRVDGHTGLLRAEIGDLVYVRRGKIGPAAAAFTDARNALSRRPRRQFLIGPGNGVAMRFQRMMQLDWSGEKSLDHRGAFGKGGIDVALLVDLGFG